MRWQGAASGITFGFGLGGLFDGFFFHAIVQWHHMLSNVIPATDMHGMVVNMVADGFFDAFCWVVIIAGIALLYRDARARALPGGKSYFGWLLLGAGLFNFVEGILDHEVLRIHHVRSVPSYAAWDIGFLLIPGLLLMVLGWAVANKARAVSAGQQR